MESWLFLYRHYICKKIRRPQKNYSFFKVYNYTPNEISILAYDSVGLIYYLWKNLGAIKSINDFNFKKDIKGKLGKFKISENKVIQDLNIYRIKEGKFIQNKF